MKKIVFPLLLIILTFTFCHSQPQVKTLVNDANAEKRSVGSFTGIQVSNAVKLYLSQGNEDAVAVSCSDAVDNRKVKTEVKNGVLKIYVETGIWGSWNNKKVKAYVSIKNINFLGASGASSVKVNEEISSTNLTLDLSGASNIKGNIKATTLKIELSGASSINIKGYATNTNIEVSGASNFKGYEFETDNCKAEASGASDISITVKKDLKAEASGASSIKYAGSPTNVSVDATGASSIKKKTDL
jgi:hypothetical protein